MNTEEKQNKQTQAAGLSIVAAATPPAHAEAASSPAATTPATTPAAPAVAPLSAAPPAAPATPESGQNTPPAEDAQPWDSPDDPPEQEEEIALPAPTPAADDEELPEPPAATTPAGENRAAGGGQPPAAEPIPYSSEPIPYTAEPIPYTSEPIPFTAESDAYWRSVFTGSADTVPEDVRRRAGADDPSLTEEQRLYLLYSTLNRSWAAAHLGMSREQVISDWKKLRTLLTTQYHVADDEEELFTALSIEAEEGPCRDAIQKVYEAHYRAALTGQAPPAYVELTPEQQNLPYLDEVAREARLSGAAMRREHLPLARELAEGLKFYTGLDKNIMHDAGFIFSMPELRRSISKLMEIEPNERQMVYAISKAMMLEERAEDPHASKPESFSKTFDRSVRRGGANVALGIGQAALHTYSALANNLGKRFDWDGAKEQAQEIDLFARIAEETRILAQEEIVPINVSKEAGLLGQALVDVGSAIPAAALACCSGAGFATLCVSGAGEAIAEARHRAPQGDHELQFAAGFLGAALQAGIYTGISRVGRTLLGNSINRFAQSSGQGIGRYAIDGLYVARDFSYENAKALLATKAGTASSLGMQELAARMSRTASNIDWEEYGDNMQDIEVNIREAAMNLPFILIGSGRMALHHFRNRRAVLGDGDLMLDWGISPKQRDAILDELNVYRQGDMLREAIYGSTLYSGPAFIPVATRSLRLLNTDYYQGFKDPQAVIDFLRLPSQNKYIPRPPLVKYADDNTAHVQELLERHGSGHLARQSRLAPALKLWDEWWQQAHILGPRRQGIVGPVSTASREVPEGTMPTEQRRSQFRRELIHGDSPVPERMRLGTYYSPLAEAERNALFRDRMAELHDLSFQLLLSSFPLDALSSGMRNFDQQRKAAETARRSMLEGVGCTVMQRLGGMDAQLAQDELSTRITNYFRHRRYSRHSPRWMAALTPASTNRMVEHAIACSELPLEDCPPELLDAQRVSLGFLSCANIITELLPTTSDFQTALSRGMTPMQAAEHILSRELGFNLRENAKVEKLMQTMGENKTDMAEFIRNNAENVEAYQRFNNIQFEEAESWETGKPHWRLLRPNGQYTRWHNTRGGAINDLVANSALMFMPYNGSHEAPMHPYELKGDFDLQEAWKPGGITQYTTYDQLCRIAVRDLAHSWLESVPYLVPGLMSYSTRKYLFMGGLAPQGQVQLQRPNYDDIVHVETFSLFSPLRITQARFRTYWFQQLNSGMYSMREINDELAKLHIITPEQHRRLERRMDIMDAMSRGLNTTSQPYTLPLNIARTKGTLSRHLTNFSLRYILTHLDDMPMPSSAKDWFRLAPLSPLPVPPLPERALKLSLKKDNEAYTIWGNRLSAQELRDMIPQLEEFRRAEQDGLLEGSPLIAHMNDALGLNPVLNLEQAWCRHHNGEAGLMGAGFDYWHLVRQPLESWQKFDWYTRNALGRYLEPVCQRDPQPEAQEAESRGELPEYLTFALQNLSDVLQQYPELHRYELTERNGEFGVQQLSLESMLRPTAPLEEPEYDSPPLYTKTKYNLGYSLGEPEPLPEFMREDPRIIPAMQALGAIRRFPASRPLALRDGILWRGELYGGQFGKHPGELSNGWYVEAPLAGLLNMLERIDELQAQLPKGKKLIVQDQPLEGLESGIDLGELRNITIYRSRQNLANVYRLMPGEPESAIPTARAPYLTHSVAGTYMYRHFPLRNPERMHRAYQPLSAFSRTYKLHDERDEVRSTHNRQSIDYTLSGVLSSTMRKASQNNPQGSIASMRELLMRFAEDTGFSDSLLYTDPHNLTAGQVLTLRLAREMLHCICSSDPAAAYHRFIRLSHRVRRSETQRGTVLGTLYRTAEEIYHRGDQLLPNPQGRISQRADEPQPQRRYQYKKGRLGSGELFGTPGRFFTKADEQKLKEWNQRQDDIERKSADSWMDGYNDDVRSDGYSRGFFDE